MDIVVSKNGCLRFVEVKTRASGDPVGVEAVGPSKRRKLIGAARAWLSAFDPAVSEMAFMVAFVEEDTIDWYDDAFDVE